MAVAQDADGIQRVSGTVLLIGTFDTKGEEYAFVRNAITGGEYQAPTRHAVPIGETEFVICWPEFRLAMSRGRTCWRGLNSN